MIPSDRRPDIEAPLDEGQRAGRQSTLPPPVVASFRSGSRLPSVIEPLPRRIGSRADEAWLRARVAQARADNDPAALRSSCSALARWLAARERDLSEAVDLAHAALAAGADGELRRELSAWLESLGDPERAAEAMQIVASEPEIDPADAAYTLVRSGLLLARTGDVKDAAASFEAALRADGADALPGELLGALAGWETNGLNPDRAAEAYAEAARRRGARWQHEAESEDQWRAVAADAKSEPAARALAEALDRRGRASAGDEIWRELASAIAGGDPGRARGIHVQRRMSALAARDPARAMSAAIDEMTLTTGQHDAEVNALEAFFRQTQVPDAVLSEIRAALSSDLVASAEPIEKLAAFSGPPLRGLLLCVAAERYLGAGEAPAAREAARRATQADPSSVRALTTLANVISGQYDRTAIAALERAVSVVGPRIAWCVSLADALDAIGDSEFSITWSQRCVSMRPGDPKMLSKLLDRLVRAADAGRLADTLAWLLSQPHPLDGVAKPFSESLCELARLDADRAVVVARRALDVFGPRNRLTRDAMLFAATRACDDAFVAAIFERSLSCNPDAEERANLLVGLAELYERLGDEEGETRVTARAVLDDFCPPAIEAHLERLAGRPASPDAQIWRMRIEAKRLSSAQDAAASALAWRQLGAALWDLADDRAGAMAAWQSAARAAGPGGYAALAADLVTFADEGFALEYLTQLVESEPDAPTAAAVAAETARAALAHGSPRVALNLAARGTAKYPASPDALDVAEMSARELGEFGTLSALYDLVAKRSLGRFGERAAHYRGARFFERTGEGARALKHAISAFRALPSEGSAFRLLARASERAGDRSEALRTLEHAAETAPRADARAGWLLRAAALAGEGADGRRHRVDLLLRAIVAQPVVTKVAGLTAAVSDLLRFEPDDRDGVELRVLRAADAVTSNLEGPHGARMAIAFSRMAVDLFDDVDAAAGLVERAFDRDPSVDEFESLDVKALARAAHIGARLSAVLIQGEPPVGHIGTRALRFVENVATAIDDARLLGHATLTAALIEPADDALVFRAVAATQRFPDLVQRLEAGVPRARRAQALLSAARAHAAANAHAEAIALFESALPLVDAAVRAEVEGELRTVIASHSQDIPEARPRPESDELATPQTRAERWTEIAERREARADLQGAVRALLEACKLDSEALGRWSALERVAEMANDVEARVLALENIASRVGVQGRIPVFKRLGRAHADRGDFEAAERVWRSVLVLDPSDDDADQAVESLLVTTARYADLAAHLGVRADLLEADPARSDSLRPLRLRRAAILEQRLGLIDEACDELERVLSDAPDNAGALRYLADLLERKGASARAAQLWARAATLEYDVEERDDLDLRAGRAASAMGNFALALEHAKRVLGRSPQNRPALDLRCDAARLLGSDEELGEALEESAAALDLHPDRCCELLVEAALAAARTGDLDRAFARAWRAASVAPEHATAQLLARGLEYRLRGAGSVEQARTTVEDLGRISDPLGNDDIALRAFLTAEALDVFDGADAGARELQTAREIVGSHPLIALGIAERLAAQGSVAEAVDAYREALSGPLLGLRSPASVALAATDAALRINRRDDALQFLDVADRYPDAKEAVAARRQRIEVVTNTMTFSRPESLPPSSVHSVQRGISRVSLAKERIELGDTKDAERLLRKALGDGFVDAGDELVALFQTLPERSAEIVQVRRLQVGIEPGSRARIEALHAAAAADDDHVYASAVEHVLRAFETTEQRIEPPPLADQPEQPGAIAMLTRPSADAMGEALSLLWDGASQVFMRDPTSYGITGVERVVPGASSAIARLYEASIRVLHAPRIPLFAPRSEPGPPQSQVALLSPPSVILTGDVRTESPDLRFELGRGLSASLPPHVLLLGLPPSEGRTLVDALVAGFGPPDKSRGMTAAAARMAEIFWQRLPPRTQRRLQQLLGSGVPTDYDELRGRAEQSGRRLGMFLAGDFAVAARVAVSECAIDVEPLSAETLRGLCERVPALADLLRLAVSPEYADARWHDNGGASRSPSGRFSLF